MGRLHEQLARGCGFLEGTPLASLVEAVPDGEVPGDGGPARIWGPALAAREGAAPGRRGL